MDNQCSRCGTCCTRNPPGLHAGDLELYKGQILGKEHLLTLRQGELVRDNVQQKILPLQQEMIRLQCKPGSRACIFYQPLGRNCSIYSSRPLECRALKCWDTREILQVYQEPRLSRLDMVDAGSALGEIIQEHEKKCAYSRIRVLVQEVLDAQNVWAEQELAEIIGIDRAMRRYLLYNAGADDAVVLFILGRKLDSTLPAFGLQIEPGSQGIRFKPSTGLD